MNAGWSLMALMRDDKGTRKEQPLGVDRLQDPAAHAFRDQASELLHLERGIGHVPNRVEGGNVLQAIQQPEYCSADDRPALGAREKLIAPAKALPLLVLGGGSGLACGPKIMMPPSARSLKGPAVRPGELFREEPFIPRQGFVIRELSAIQ
jgi:hypothetical protein